MHTMMHLNTEYTNLPKNEQEICTECVKRESAIMTAPHHGSDHSSMGKKIVADKAKYSEMPDRYKGDWGIYREFLDNYKPSAVTISAGRNYGFGHPGPEFVKATDCYFNNTGANEHIIYTCIHEDSKTNTMAYIRLAHRFTVHCNMTRTLKRFTFSACSLITA